MKKGNFIDFKFINPFKTGIYFSLIFNFTNKEYKERYIYCGFIFFSVCIDF